MLATEKAFLKMLKIKFSAIPLKVSDESKQIKFHHKLWWRISERF